MELTAQDIRDRFRQAVEEALPRDLVGDPIYPDGRDDVAAVRWTRGSSDWLADAIVLLWKDGEGRVHHKEIASNSGDHDIFINEITAEGDQITVRHTDGEWTGSPWRNGG